MGLLDYLNWENGYADRKPRNAADAFVQAQELFGQHTRVEPAEELGDQSDRVSGPYQYVANPAETDERAAGWMEKSGQLTGLNADAITEAHFETPDHTLPIEYEP
jgi:hypothetical protein